MQTSYSLYASEGMAGQLADSGYHNVMSYSAEEAIGIGRAVVRGAADNTCRLPNRNYATLTFDADFVTSNTIDLDVNGVAISQVTFASSHAATFAAVVAAIAALANVSAVAGTGRSIIITTDNGADISVTDVVVAGGASQAVGTTVYTSGDIMYGVALHTHTLVQDSNGVVQYAQYETVNAMSQGRCYVPVEQDVAVGDPVYVRVLVNGSDTPGGFRMDADSEKAILVSNARWVKGALDGGLAIVEFNLP